MDFYADAVLDYAKSKTVDFKFDFGDGIKYPHDLSRYFRNFAELQPIEKHLISLSKGKILDVGSSTGYYLSFMEKQGKVTGLEIAKKLVEFGNHNYTKNLIQGDIFSLVFNEKYDTITLLENNLGMCKDVEGLNKFISIFDGILTPEGQILIMTKKYDKKNHKYNFNNITTLTPYWNGKKGIGFNWITFDQEYLANIFLKYGFVTEQVFLDEDNLLLRVTRI